MNLLTRMFPGADSAVVVIAAAAVGAARCVLMNATQVFTSRNEALRSSG